MQYIVCDIVSFGIIDIERGHRRFVSLFQEFGLRLHESPGTVILRVVFQREFFLDTVFLINKGVTIFVFRCSVGNSHQRWDIRPDLIRTEIYDRQMVIVPIGEPDTGEVRKQGNKPIHFKGKALKHLSGIHKHHNRRCGQYQVLEEGLPVGDNDRITETATIGNRIEQGQI